MASCSVDAVVTGWAGIDVASSVSSDPADHIAALPLPLAVPVAAPAAIVPLESRDHCKRLSGPSKYRNAGRKPGSAMLREYLQDNVEVETPVEKMDRVRSAKANKCQKDSQSTQAKQLANCVCCPALNNFAGGGDEFASAILVPACRGTGRKHPCRRVANAQPLLDRFLTSETLANLNANAETEIAKVNRKKHREEKLALGCLLWYTVRLFWSGLFSWLCGQHDLHEMEIESVTDYILADETPTLISVEQKCGNTHMAGSRATDSSGTAKTEKSATNAKLLQIEYQFSIVSTCKNNRTARRTIITGEVQ